METNCYPSSLQVRDLSFAYSGQHPIIYPDIEVTSDNPLLILGDSGCGKSTFMYLLSGLLKPNRGSVLLNGVNISKLNPMECDSFRGQNIGMIFQQPHFIEALTVYDNIKISPYLNQNTQPLTQLESSIRALNLTSLMDKLPSRLSMGEQQRVSIIRALTNQPSLILADEPTSALDNKNCSAVIDLLIQIARQINAVLIICTHDERIRRVIANEIDFTKLTYDNTENR